MRKAQSAMEFLMTYGWAILAVMVALGALAYTGVINPMNFLPNSCIASSTWTCVGKPYYSVDGIGVPMIRQSVKVNIGYDLVILPTASISGFPQGCKTLAKICTQGSTECYANGIYVGAGSDIMTVPGQPSKIVDESIYALYVSCPGMSKGTRFKGRIDIDYVNPTSGITKKATLQISGK